MNQDAKIEKLQKKHDAEKAAALQEFNNFKAKMQDRDQKIAAEFKKKYDGLRTDVEAMNGRFQERIAQFESANKDLKAALADAAKSGSDGVAQMKLKYEHEMEEMVRVSNDKYHAMLAEQLRVQEQIKSDMEQRMQALQEDMLRKYQADLDRELGQERARLGASKEEALMELRRDLEGALSQQKGDLSAVVDKLNAELKAKTAEHAASQSKAEITIADLNEKLALVRQSLNEQVGGSEQKLGSMSRELLAVKETLSETQARVRQKEEELSSLQGRLTEKNAELVALESKLAASEAEVERLRKELALAQQSGAASSDELKQRLAAAQREADSFRDEINHVAATLAGVRDDMKRADKAAQKAAQDANKTIEDLKSEREMLNLKISDLRKAMQGAESDASSQVAALQKQMAAKEAALNEERMLALQQSQKSMDALRESHRVEAEALKMQQESMQQAFAVKESALKDEITDMHSRHKQELEDMETRLQQQMDEASSSHESQAQELRSSLAAMESQLQVLAEQAEAERTTLRGEASKWEGKAKGLQKELDSRKKEGERAESVMTGLKNQVESLREELKASQKAFREKMDISAAKLEAEWQARLEAAVAEGEKALSSTQSELLEKHRKELEELVRRHGEDIDELKTALQQEAAFARADLAAVERQKQQLEADLVDAKAAHAAEVKQLRDEHSMSSRSTADKHTEEIERIRRELKSAAEAREALLTQSHNAEVERLNALVESTSVNLTQEMANALQACKLSADAAQRSALKQQEEDLIKQREAALKKQADQDAAELHRVQCQLESEKAGLDQSLQDVKQQCKVAQGEVSSLQKTINHERSERQRREEEFVISMDQRDREHEADLRREKEETERKLIEVMDRANADMKILKQEHMEVRGQYEERIAEMRSEYSALEVRWRNRESRPEDIARIEQLMREMVEKDELVLRTREEMMYFKREMLNREENYNQKFGRSPNVGVLNPIKTKDPAGDGKGERRAKPTQMRMVNPNGGGTMGLAMGNAAGAAPDLGGSLRSVGPVPAPNLGGGSFKNSKSAK